MDQPKVKDHKKQVFKFVNSAYYSSSGDGEHKYRWTWSTFSLDFSQNGGNIKENADDEVQ